MKIISEILTSRTIVYILLFILLIFLSGCSAIITDNEKECMERIGKKVCEEKGLELKYIQNPQFFVQSSFQIICREERAISEIKRFRFIDEELKGCGFNE